MKTHELQLIRVIDELNDRNAEIRARNACKPQIEAYSYGIWENLGLQEAIC